MDARKQALGSCGLRYCEVRGGKVQYRCPTSRMFRACEAGRCSATTPAVPARIGAVANRVARSRTGHDEGEVMPMPRDVRAFVRGAQPRPGHALILGGLLLLTLP